MTELLLPPTPPQEDGPRLRARERWWPSRPGVVARLAVIAVLLAGVLASPMAMPDVSVNVYSRVVTYVIVALSLNILIGYTGQVSLGHAAFYGAGAFAAGIATTELGVPWAVGVGAAMLVGALAALALGLVALRVKGLYLALVTLAYGLFAYEVVFGLGAVSRGGAGMPADRPAWALGDRHYAYVCLAALAVVWLLDWRLTSSRVGRAIQALRDSEKVAASWGIDVTRHKLLAFVLSGIVAGLAGALFASIEQIVTAESFRWDLSLLFLFMAVVGGAGSRVGVAIGALLLGFNEFFLDRISDQYEGFPLDGSAAGLVGALLVLVVLLWVPGGIAQPLRGIVRWLSFRPLAAPTSGAGETSTVGGDDARP